MSNPRRTLAGDALLPGESNIVYFIAIARLDHYDIRLVHE